MISKWVSSMFRLIGMQMWTLCLLAFTGLLCIATTYLIVWPAYQNPVSRMYTSKLGYSTVIRQSGGAFPVRAAKVQHRKIVGKFIGEGLMQSEPVQVPLVAMSRILKVHVKEGQRIKKGDVVAELDHSRLDMKIASARAALETARAEWERVQLGTVNVLQYERPDLLEIRQKSATADAKFADEILAINTELNEHHAVSKTDLAKSRLEKAKADLMRRQKQIEAEMALEGRKSSIRIAESAIREAEMTLNYRLSEQIDYVSRSPADGIVERVLVHDGEYNQDPGRPAVLLACGLWFECYLDQTALGKVAVGDRVKIRLSAYQDRVFDGSIGSVRPLVNFALGGPETNRPIRPLGTGAPEWPATFAVRVQLEPTESLVVPGLTGYATVVQERSTLCIPRGSVSAVSGNRGIVFVVGDDGESFEPRSVVTGITDHEFVEIREGLAEDETVIFDGYQVLEPGDRIAIRDADKRDHKVRLVGRRGKGAADDQATP